MTKPETKFFLDVEAIKRLLPHRPPFLFLEKLTDIVPGQSATGWKAVSVNEPYFAGHFPEYAIMPGVLVVEAMAQAAGALVMHSLGEERPNLVFFMSIDYARFRKPVRPGDLLRIPVLVQQHRGPVWRFEGKAFCGDILCAEAEYSAMIADSVVGRENASLQI
ncbi:MAG: 3-hydroxyacyl-ACP dehydratase FabZ [Alphaproteobacteria bacterium]